MREKAVLAAVLLVALAPSLYVFSLSAGMLHFGRFQDDGIYWLSAKSLAEGQGYIIPSLPRTPWQTKYPPLFPALLSLIWRAYSSPPGELVAAGTFAWAFLPLLLLITWRLFADFQLGGRRSCILLLVIGWSPAVAYMSTTLMAELMFACLLLLSLHYAEEAAGRRPGMWTALASGLFAAAAFLTKTAAVPLVLTVPLCLLIRRRRLEAVCFLCGVLPCVALWVLWVASHRSPGSDVVTLYYTNYLGYQMHNFQFALLPAMLWKNAAGLLAGIGGLLVVDTGDAQGLKILGRLFGMLALLGLIRLARRTLRFQHVAFLGGYFLTLLAWHFPPSERFVLPVLPILLMGLSEEILSLAALVRRSLRTPDLAHRGVAAGLTLAFLGSAGIAAWAGGVTYLRYFPQFFEKERVQLASDRRLYSWIAASTPSESLFLAYRDTRLSLYTGRHAIRLIVPPRLYYQGDAGKTGGYFQSLPEFIRRHGVTHVLVTAGDHYSLDVPDIGLPIVRQVVSTDRRFRPLFRVDGSTLYETGRPD
ncbi:MAG: hypothetical protein IT159_02720 [Bryobacterales bacterium]|nr:hypothetical protein [Bryobacterales bacterium]